MCATRGHHAVDALTEINAYQPNRDFLNLTFVKADDGTPYFAKTLNTDCLSFNNLLVCCERDRRFTIY
jgi:hypothetical protein